MMQRIILAVGTPLLLAAIAGAALAQRGERPQGPPTDRDASRMNPWMRIFDADGDGVLSEEEMAAAGKKLRDLDRNADGKLTEEELFGAMPFGRGRPIGGPGGPGAGGPGGPGGPGRGGPGGPGRGGPGGTLSEADLEKPPVPKDEEEKRIVQAIDTMRQGPRYANVSTNDGRLLRLLAETLEAKKVVEIGTSTGESATWLALGLRKTGGHLFTHEIDEGRARVALENFKKAGVDELITLVPGDAHETVARYKEPIDILFLDADKEGYIDYLEKLLPLIRPGGLVIAHNMNTRQADPRFVEAITEDPALETLILLKEGTGVSVTLKKR